MATKLNNTRPRVCVIGAGLGGLSAARRLKEAGIEFVVLESTNYIGGTWRYEEKVGTDEYGFPIHTSMYSNLRANVPKLGMQIPEFELPKDGPEYMPSEYYLDYLKKVPERFGFEENLKFLHRVILVKREDDSWRVKHEHLPTKCSFEEDFDYVIVATGHYSHPRMPNLKGEDIFKGTIIHSHDYRRPDPYSSRRVLVIGSGGSGLEIVVQVTEVSYKTVHSYHAHIDYVRTPFPANYVRKPDVKELTENGAVFEDGSFEELDDVIYATGYDYYYPFLDDSCGLTVTSKYVTPLYKGLVNINQPTMFIIGVLFIANLATLVDAQARYVVSVIKGNFALPSREDMMKKLKEHIDALQSEGRQLRHLHSLWFKEDQYYADLTAESGIERVKPVMAKILLADFQALLDNLYTFRNYEYKIVDDETFTKTLIEEKPTKNATP